MKTKTWGLSEADHERRRGFLTGSRAPRIVTGDWLQIYNELKGIAKPEDLSRVLRVQMGLFTEAGNRFWYTQETGRSISHVQEWIVHPNIKYLACTVDGLTTTSHGAAAIFETKHVGRNDEAMELRAVAQATHNALCAGVEYFVLSVFISNNRWELYEERIVPGYAEEYRAKCAELWGYIERGEPPPEAAPLPVPPPRRLRVIELDDEASVFWPNWAPEMVAKIRTFAETKPAADLHAITRERIKDLMPEDVGEVRHGLFRAKRDRAGRVLMSLKKGESDE